MERRHLASSLKMAFVRLAKGDAATMETSTSS